MRGSDLTWYLLRRHHTLDRNFSKRGSSMQLYLYNNSCSPTHTHTLQNTSPSGGHRTICTLLQTASHWNFQKSTNTLSRAGVIRLLEYCSHQFAEVAPVDFDHLSSDAQTRHIILKVQLHPGQGGRRYGQTHWVTVDQSGLLGRRTCLCTHTHAHTQTHNMRRTQQVG